MSELKRVLIMAGGTGGHVFPGLTLANYLKEQRLEVHWLGTRNGLEAQLVPSADIPLHLISISGLRGKGIKTLVTSPVKLYVALLQALRILKEINPDIVIGMGGFVSGPGGLASWMQQKRLIIHEQNAYPGLTNQMLSRIAKKTLSAFPNAFKPHAKVVVTGNPVRPEIENLQVPEKRLRQEGRFRLLVLGGSLGAKAINDLLPKAIAQLKNENRPHIIHQTGEKHFASTKAAYDAQQVEAHLVPFIKEMEQAYAWADMVLCRAGALTISELCSVGVGAILVPYPYAVDDHQTANANHMVKHQAAVCMQQSELTPHRLADMMQTFSQYPDKRLEMAKAAYALRKTNVTERIFEICKEVCT